VDVIVCQLVCSWTQTDITVIRTGQTIRKWTRSSGLTFHAGHRCFQFPSLLWHSWLVTRVSSSIGERSRLSPPRDLLGHCSSWSTTPAKGWLKKSQQVFYYDYDDDNYCDQYYYSRIYYYITNATATLREADLWMKLLFSPSVAVGAVVSVVTLRWIAPFITVLHARTRRWSVRQQLHRFSRSFINEECVSVLQALLLARLKGQYCLLAGICRRL